MTMYTVVILTILLAVSSVVAQLDEVKSLSLAQNAENERDKLVDQVNEAKVEFRKFGGKMSLLLGEQFAANISLLKMKDSTDFSFDSFEAARFAWTGPETVTIGGLNAKQYKASAAFTVYGGSKDLKLQLNAFLFDQPAVVPFAGVNVAVPSKAVKFTVLIENWPFSATPTSGSLFNQWVELFLRVETTGTSPVVSSQADGSTVLNIGRSILSLPNVAVADTGSIKTITTTSDSVVFQGVNRHADVRIRFPYFSRSIELDPVLSFKLASPQSNSAISHLMGSILPLIMMLLAALLMILV